VAVLATSREGLALAGEQLVAVPSLHLPATDDAGEVLAHSAAVRLFVDRAQDVERDFALTEHHAPAVVQLCRRLDGIPLAIELAAARVRSLSPQDLVDRLDQRFRLLTRGSRIGLERHQTLRSTIDWSYDLLSETERVALNRLSVFAGGCDLAAAEAVLPGGDLEVGEVVEVLGQLVDKSLVLVDPDQPTGTRYLLLETIRQYAQEHLEADGEAPTLRARHAHYYLGVAETAAPGLVSREQLTVAAAMAREVDNFRAVLDWALEVASAGHALRLVVSLGVMGTPIGDTAMGWADAARTIPGAADHQQYPAVVAEAALGKATRGDYEQAQDLAAAATEAQERLGTQHPVVGIASAAVAFLTGDSERAHQHVQEGIRQARASGDPFALSGALTLLGATQVAWDLEQATATLEEAVQIARDAGLASLLADELPLLAGMLGTTHPEEALPILDEARDIGLLVGNRLAVSQVAVMHGYLAIWRGDWDAALRAACDAADQQLALGDLAMLPTACAGAAVALAHLDACEAAAVLFGASDNWAASYGADWTEELARTEAILVATLGEDKVSALRARGQATPAADVVAYLHAETERVLTQ
jgi:predicted ATPase